MTNSQILIDTFKTKDSNGKIHFISCYQAFTKTGYFDQTSEILADLKELWCASGPVKLIDEHTFQIVATNLVVHKVMG